jgi:hypothetical protein
VNYTLTQVDKLIPKLQSQAPRVAPTLASLRPAVSNLDVLLRNATPLLDKLRPAVHAVADAATAGVPVIGALKPSLVRLEKTILPSLDRRYPEEGGLATYQIIGGTIASLSTIGHFFDSAGTLANLTLGGNAFNQTSSSILPCNVDFSGKDLLVCETLSQALATFTNLGTSTLQSLRRSTHAGSGMGAWLDRAISANGQFAMTAEKLKSLYPTLGKWLLASDHGGVRLK